jgi:hypothetical protein
MKQMKIRKLIILLSTFLITILISCNLDQVESKYSDFKSADEKGLFEKGWIPKELVAESMTEIYLLTNLDRNTCVFTYLTTENDLERIKTIIQPLDSEETMKYVPQSKELIISIEKLRQNFIVTNDKSDTIYIAIDDSINRVFGWRK